MQEDWEAWQEAQIQSSALWKGKQKRSCFNLKAVEKNFLIAEAGKWQRTDTLVQAVAGLFESFGQSRLSRA